MTWASAIAAAGGAGLMAVGQAQAQVPWVGTSEVSSRASLMSQWLTLHLPEVLLVEAPFGLRVWQWLALALAATLAFSLGHFAGRITQAVLAHVASRTRAEWDDALIPRMAGPLRVAWALGLGRMFLLALDLPQDFLADLRSWIRGAFVLVFFWASARGVDVLHQVILTSAWGQAHPSSRSMLALAGRLLKVAVYAFGVVALLSDFGFPVASLVAGLGIGGLALALAGQKTVENLFGAFSIGADQPFREGDYVKVEDFTGTVEAIGLRSTKFRTLDRTLISIPNGKLAEMRLETYAARDRLRFLTNVILPFTTRSTQVRAILQGIKALLEAHPKLWRESLSVSVKELVETGMTVEVMAWFKTIDWAEFVAIREELLLGILEVVERAKAELAQPVRIVRVVPDPNAASIFPPQGDSTHPPQTR